MKIHRQPRKQMKLSEAMIRLECSRSTVRNLIYVEKRLHAVSRKPGTTSPLKVYAREVEEVAAEWGL